MVADGLDVDEAANIEALGSREGGGHVGRWVLTLGNVVRYRSEVLATKPGVGAGAGVDSLDSDEADNGTRPAGWLPSRLFLGQTSVASCGATCQLCDGSPW